MKREPKQEPSQLIRDTEIIKKILEKHFDRKFDYKADETATIPNAVLFVLKEKVRKQKPENGQSESQNGQGGSLNIRELAEHWQHDSLSVRGLTKERARRCADPLPIFHAYGKMVKSEKAKADAWLLRKGSKPKAAVAKAIFDNIMRDSNCEHEPKHLKGLCLACYNDDLQQDVEEEMQLIRAKTKAAKAVFDKSEVPRGLIANLAISYTVQNGRHYLRIEVQRASELTRVFASLAKALDHLFDRAFDIVVSIENGNTVVTIRTGDREQDWMTVGDVAAKLSELLDRPIHRSTVRELTKERAQKRDNPLLSHKGHSKMILFWRPEFEAWFDKHWRTGRKLGKREL